MQNPLIETKSLFNYLYGKDGTLNLFGKIVFFPFVMFLLAILTVIEIFIWAFQSKMKVFDMLFLKKEKR